MFLGRRPWRGAREIIDWENLGRSLLDDPKYRKKPLSEKTRRRIARGLQRFGGPLEIWPESGGSRVSGYTWSQQA